MRTRAIKRLAVVPALMLTLLSLQVGSAHATTASTRAAAAQNHETPGPNEYPDDPGQTPGGTYPGDSNPDDHYTRETCECASITTALHSTGTMAESDGMRWFGFVLDWRLECTPGRMADCGAQIEIGPSTNGQIRIDGRDRSTIPVNCRADFCGDGNQGRVFFVVGVPVSELSRPVHVVVPIHRKCNQGDSWIVTPASFDVVNGTTDRGKMDLDGDGTPDVPKCKCASVKAWFENPRAMGRVVPGDGNTWYALDLMTTITCTPGRISECGGIVEVGKPSAGTLRQDGSNGAFTVACTGVNCNETTERNLFMIGLQIDSIEEKGVDVTIPIKFRCLQDNWSEKTFTVHIVKNKIDGSHSDLDGDGKIDVVKVPGKVPGKPKVKCKCKKIFSGADMLSSAASGATHVTTMRVDYRMLCTPGDTSDCKGEIEVGGSIGGNVPSKGKLFKCNAADCTGATGSLLVTHKVAEKQLRNRTVKFTVVVWTRCIGHDWSRRAITFVLVNGAFDAAHSDLNGDGRPDGR